MNTTTDLTLQGSYLVLWNLYRRLGTTLTSICMCASFACKRLAAARRRWLAGVAVALHARHTARLESFTSGYHPSLPASIGDTKRSTSDPDFCSFYLLLLLSLLLNHSSACSRVFFFHLLEPFFGVFSRLVSRLCVSLITVCGGGCA